MEKVGATENLRDEVGPPLVLLPRIGVDELVRRQRPVAAGQGLCRFQPVATQVPVFALEFTARRCAPGQTRVRSQSSTPPPPPPQASDSSVFRVPCILWSELGGRHVG